MLWGNVQVSDRLALVGLVSKGMGRTLSSGRDLHIPRPKMAKQAQDWELGGHSAGLHLEGLRDFAAILTLSLLALAPISTVWKSSPMLCIVSICCDGN